MKNIQITELEKQVIQNIIKSEYMDVEDERMVNWGIWSFSATNERKDLAGALGSLCKKGLCFSVDGDKNDPVCGLTKEGYEYAKENNLIK